MSSLVFKDACLASFVPECQLVWNVLVHIFILLKIWLHCSVALDVSTKSEATLSWCFSIFLPLHHSLCIKINNLARLRLCPLLRINFSWYTQCALSSINSILPSCQENILLLHLWIPFRSICWAIYLNTHYSYVGLLCLSLPHI